ncbi:alkene reductase [Halieaceae bacterium IMCC14734]|uniref:Alkene reductase n=1 Tax=Candidatus Litorirhabdus singularis TaxID=2518993 RepID=A0ABT3TL69_9GAMM|nr:alkene reductase [Candidatus Litorirhabdus singularis]MCX2983058.1 alkene reductase [Candidatus Litorirhabdus singularis]
MSNLFSSGQLGRIKVNNRIIMAPMTRSRADAAGNPTPMMLDYYRQRASAGLIIAEGTYPSENGKGYCRTPGIVNQQQIDAWGEITAAVRAEGGKMVLQIMHCGRCSHADNKSTTAETVAPSAIGAEGEVFTEAGMKPFSAPRALHSDEIPQVIEEYRQATHNAYAAGFDGVELHATSGYLPAQFMSPGSNQRSDHYGGSLENRLRFVVETLQAMASVDGADRVGIRICPGFPFNDVKDPDPKETFEGLLSAIDPMQLAYLHLMRASPLDVYAMVQEFFSGPFIINGGYNRISGDKAIAERGAAAVSFATLYIANPDLVKRLHDDLPMAEPDQATLYTNTTDGYSEYTNYSG